MKCKIHATLKITIFEAHLSSFWRQTRGYIYHVCYHGLQIDYECLLLFVRQMLVANCKPVQSCRQSYKFFRGKL